MTTLLAAIMALPTAPAPAWPLEPAWLGLPALLVFAGLAVRALAGRRPLHRPPVRSLPPAGPEPRMRVAA